MNQNDLRIQFLLQAQTSLESAISKITSARSDTSFGRYITLLGAIIDYINYQIYLQTAKDLSVDLLVDPENSTLADWKAALTALTITLENKDVSAANGWDRDSGIRVKEAYKAVWKIINKIAKLLLMIITNRLMIVTSSRQWFNSSIHLAGQHLALLREKIHITPRFMRLRTQQVG